MKKSIIITIMAILLVLAIVACQKINPFEPDNTNEEPTTTEETNIYPTPTPPPAPPSTNIGCMGVWSFVSNWTEASVNMSKYETNIINNSTLIAYTYDYTNGLLKTLNVSMGDIVSYDNDNDDCIVTFTVYSNWSGAWMDVLPMISPNVHYKMKWSINGNSMFTGSGGLTNSVANASNMTATVDTDRAYSKQ